jgi:phosphoglycolate phosphatase-like HAD superfamily hydrolase
MDYDAFVFDLDGTLVYTPPEFRYSLVGGILGRLGLADAQVRSMQGAMDVFWFCPDRSETVRSRFGVDPEEFWEEYRRRDTVDLRRMYARPYDDWEIIKELKRCGKKTGIVTSAPQHIADFEIGLLGKPDGLFDSVVLARTHMGVNKKPHPQGLVVCMQEPGVDRERASYTGNSEEDVLMAGAAGVCSVLIERGEHVVDERFKPSLRIQSLCQLRELI